MEPVEVTVGLEGEMKARIEEKKDYLL